MAINREAVLRIIIVFHFFCTSMVNMASWLPFSYTLDEMAILVLGVWAIVNVNSAIQLEILMVVEFFSIIIDCIAIGMYFEIGRDAYRNLRHKSYFDLSASFAIGLLVLKPAILLALNKVRQNRLGGNTTPTFGGWAGDANGTTPAPVPGYIPIPDSQAV